MGFCGCSLRSTRIFAAIFSLIQASAWLGSAIAALSLYNCNIVPILSLDLIDLDISFSSLVSVFSDLLYLAYFYNVECEVDRPYINVTDPTGTVTLTWSQETQVPVTRTHSWMITYTVLTSLWIVASAILLIVACGNKKGKSTAAWHYPWIVVTAAITIADVVATVIYFLDMNDMDGEEDLLRFIGVEGLDTLPEGTLSNSTSLFTAVPAMTMGLIYARFFIIWILNFTLIIYVGIATKDVSKVESKPTGWESVEPTQQNGPTPPSNQPVLARNIPLHSSVVQGQSPSNYPYRPQTPPNKQLASYTQHPQSPSNPQHPQSPSYPQHPQSPNYYQPPQSPSYSQSPQSHNYSQHSQSPSYTSDQDIFSYGLAQRHAKYPNQSQTQRYSDQVLTQPQQLPQSQKYPNQPQPYPAKHSIAQPQRLSQQSQVKDQRYQNQQLGSVNPAFENDVPYNVRSSAPEPPKKPSVTRNESMEARKRAPTELRSQLPWSYFQSSDDHVNVKQYKIPEEDGDLPPIPVPDYTLHFPKKRRGELKEPSRQSSMTNNKNDVLY